MAMVLAVCLGLAMATTLTGAAGSYYYKHREHKAGGRRSPGKVPGLAGVATALLLVIIVPVIAIYLQPGILGPVTQHVASDVKISTFKAGNNTIMITHDSGSTIFKNGLPQAYILDAERPFTILVDGKDASTTNAIVKSGLNASISPAGGLTPAEGSSVTITGKDILPEAGNGNHLVVVCHFTNEKDLIVYDRLLT